MLSIKNFLWRSSVICLAFLFGIGCSTDIDDDIPDGYIAFTSNRDGNDEIYIMNVDGTDQINLTNHPSNDRAPVWSPDGTQIAFVSDREGTTDIYIMQVDGSKQMNLTKNPAYDYFPTWSPDGRYIMFVSYRDGVQSEQGKPLPEVYVMEADGSNPKRLTNNLFDEGHLSWSPNKDLVALTVDVWPDKTSDEFSKGIYLINSDGTGLIRLTGQNSKDEYPNWSPDGQKIAFMSYRTGGSEIFVMKSDGSEQMQLTINQDVMSYNIHPSWSPNGDHIVFTSRHDENYDIYLMRSDGSKRIRLTDNSSLELFPAWSP